MKNLLNVFNFLLVIFLITTSCSNDNDVPDDIIIEEPKPTLEKHYVTNVQNIFNSYTIKNFLNDGVSELYYYEENFNQNVGGSFILDYKDQGGKGMDSYPNITIGGYKQGGKWFTGDKNFVGMPAQLKDIDHTLSFEWTTSQENAFDEDDKWMASINFIFDNYGDETSEPLANERDYDLVVMHDYHNFDDSVDDKPIGSSTTHWYFARNTNGSLKYYNLVIDGKTYSYAIRYKFFVNAGDKNNKAHVKFIPHNNGIPPVLKVNIKDIVMASKDFIQFANIPETYKDLALINIANDNAWLKSVNAGYEVYTGNSILNINKFKMSY